MEASEVTEESPAGCAGEGKQSKGVGCEIQPFLIDMATDDNRRIIIEELSLKNNRVEGFKADVLLVSSLRTYHDICVTKCLLRSSLSLST